MSISSSAHIASSSLIAAGAMIGAHVTIGPFCLISADVVIGEGTIVGSHSVINGLTTIGRDNHIGHFSSIGEVNQDLKYAGEPTRLVIGDRNMIGNNVSLHLGTVQGGSCTTIGNDNRLMNSVHIGHDCIVGNGTTMRNNSGLAGHVELGDGALVGAMCAIHQFCIVGAHAIIADQSGAVQDIPPFVKACGNHAKPDGINIKSSAFIALSLAEKELIQTIYSMLYQQSLPAEEVKQWIKIWMNDFEVARIFGRFFTRSKRGIIR